MLNLFSSSFFQLWLYQTTIRWTPFHVLPLVTVQSNQVTATHQAATLVPSPSKVNPPLSPPTIDPARAARATRRALTDAEAAVEMQSPSLVASLTDNMTMTIIAPLAPVLVIRTTGVSIGMTGRDRAGQRFPMWTIWVLAAWPVIGVRHYLRGGAGIAIRTNSVLFRSQINIVCNTI